MPADSSDDDDDVPLSQIMAQQSSASAAPAPAPAAPAPAAPAAWPSRTAVRDAHLREPLHPRTVHEPLQPALDLIRLLERHARAVGEELGAVDGGERAAAV